MPLIAKPSSIMKGTDALFTLDKAALAQLPVVDADDYFRDTNNWKEVRLIYKSAFGGKEEVVFDASPLHPTGKFNVSLRGRGLFDFDAIYIEDFDHGYLLIGPASLPAEEFEVDIQLPPELKLSDWMYLSKIFSLSEDYVAS
jgi:hypothetical protein